MIGYDFKKQLAVHCGLPKDAPLPLIIEVLNDWEEQLKAIGYIVEDEEEEEQE